MGRAGACRPAVGGVLGSREEGGAGRGEATGGRTESEGLRRRWLRAGGGGMEADARLVLTPESAPNSGQGPDAEEGAQALAEFAALHGPALRASGVPERYWGRLLHKLEHEVFDAGEMFGIMQVEEVEEEEESEEEAAQEAHKKKPNPGSERCYKVIVTNENRLQAADPNSIFLIDHAWTCHVEHARQQLYQVPGLLHRMANLMGVEFHGELPSTEAVDQVLEEMWKFNQTYQLSHGTAEEKVPVWYIMDEFGSRIQHSDVPSFATAPFFYMPQQVAYTLLWPLRDLDTGEEVTRDFAYGETDPLIRKCMLLPWAPANMLDLNSCTPEPPDVHYQAILEENKEKLPLAIDLVAYPYPSDHVFKVYTDVQQVLSHLTHPRFTLAQSEADADILYNFSHFKDFRKLSQERPHVLLNQFPCENLLTVKDCLASIARRAGGPEGPAWLPRTFNLRTELPQFVSYFQQRESRGEDNHWICKPWNLARSLDTHVTKNLHSIIRHRESSPKVVSKYIESPVLFLREDVGRVKFDVRYIVLLRSVKPLRLFVYDVFWLRFSNRPFALNDLDDYEKHFTVMNYDPEVVLKQVHYDDFIPEFEKQYPEFPWKSVQESK
ncbi:tubulin--tyrosine ligase-like protein 12 isoform X2 [Saccopteryx leptura]|uniref:tubulin--tyrosine ligase-like protein 12 isoform X2 n=1 Tax=Saccopteryx leptura TaxID=249018 RepID=UPI00339CA862